MTEIAGPRLHLGELIAETEVEAPTLTGDLVGNVTGNLTGNSTGTHTGAVVATTITASGAADFSARSSFSNPVSMETTQVSASSGVSTAVFTAAPGSMYELMLSVDALNNYRAVLIAGFLDGSGDAYVSGLRDSPTGQFVAGATSGVNVMATQSSGTTRNITVRARKLYSAHGT